MGKRKAGIPAGFKLDLEKPDESTKPIRRGDYLDEIDARPTATAVVTPPVQVEPKQKTEPPKREAKITVANSVSAKRTRLNVSHEARERLSKIVGYMRQFGPEDDIRASEVLEATILALYEAREHLDLSNVRRRGKWGSPTHKMFPIALAESVSKGIASAAEDKIE